jgi:hypothetical protein
MALGWNGMGWNGRGVAIPPLPSGITEWRAAHEQAIVSDDRMETGISLCQ